MIVNSSGLFYTLDEIVVIYGGRYWMLQGVFRILIFESRQMKDVRLLDERLERRESRWVMKACMSCLFFRFCVFTCLNSF